MRSAVPRQNPFNQDDEGLADEVIRIADNLATNVRRLKSSPIYMEADVSLKSTCFDFVDFTDWYSQTLKKYRENPNADWRNIPWEITSYMNRSICFVELTKPVYYVLSWSTLHQQTYWKLMLVADFKTQFASYPVTIMGYKKNKEGMDVEVRKDTNLYDVYCNNPVKRIHRDVVFEPARKGQDRSVNPEVLNLWMGYRWSEDEMRNAAKCMVARQVCFDFWKMFYELHCKSSPTLFIYCVDWYATKMRFPGRKLSTSITYYSKKQRCGKGKCRGCLVKMPSSIPWLVQAEMSVIRKTRSERL